MSKMMNVKDKVYFRLTELKGECSYSEAIEQIMTKAGIAMPDNSPKLPSIATATYPAIKQGEGNE